MPENIKHITNETGKNQHYIPRFLMRGFKTRESRRHEFTNFFSKDNTGKEVKIARIGCMDFFYVQGDINADLYITDLEQLFAPAVNKARQDKSICSGQLPKIIDFILQMAVRTNHTRLIFQHMANHHASAILQKVFSSENFYSLLDKALSRKKAAIKNDTLSKHALTLAKEFLICKYQNSFLSEKFWHIVRQEISSNAQPHIASKVMQSQLCTLCDNTILNTRRNQLSALHWSVQEFPPKSLILGDVCVFAVNELNEADALLFSTKPSCVFLPISSQTLLIGVTDNYQHNLTLHDINRYSASLSLDFFITDSSEPHLQEYQKLLATTNYRPNAVRFEKWISEEFDPSQYF